MGRNRRRSMRQRANEAVAAAAQRIDDSTGQAAGRAAHTLALTVRVLRVPTAVIGVIPIPFIVAVLLLGVQGSGLGSIIAVIGGAIMAVLSGLFFIRRQQLLNAVDDPEQLATELAIMAELSGRTHDGRGVLLQIAGDSGFAVFSRLRRLWSAAQPDGHWIRGIGDLPRAKWFGPPRIGTTIMLSISALWLIPISVIACLFTFIAVVAGSL